MFKRTISSLLLVAAFVVSQAVQGQEGHDPMALYREAGVSQQQQKQISELVQQFEAPARQKSERAMQLLKKMQDYSLEPLPDEKQVMQTQGEINALQAEMANSRIGLTLKIRQLLTPGQREKLVKLLKEQQQQQAGH